MLEVSDPTCHPFNSLLNKSFLGGGGGVVITMCQARRPCCPMSVGELELARSGYSFEATAPGRSHRVT